MAWYNSSWLYRVKVTVLAAKVAADHTDFPVYVDLNDLPAGFHSHCNQTDARDIRVTTSDEVTEVPREVVFYTAASDTGELWFKGTIDGDDNTDFYIYYGNAAATEPAEDATYGRENVWSSNYEAVYHLQGNYNDSTSHDHDGSSDAAPDASTGKIGAAYDFVAANTDYINLGGNGTALMLGGTSYTIQFWNNIDSTSGARRWINTDDGNDTNDGFSIAGWGAGSVMWTHNNGSTSPWTVTGLTTTTGVWYKWDFVYDTVANYRYMYQDGASKGTPPSTTVDQAAHATNNVWLGRMPVHNQCFDGDMDEVRLLTSPLSANWITTEYNNQADTDNFFTIGAEEMGGTSVEVSVSALTTEVSLLAPTITTTIGALIQPSALELTLSIPEVGITAKRKVTISPDTLVGTFTLPDPAINTEIYVIVTPDPVEMSLSINQPLRDYNLNRDLALDLETGHLMLQFRPFKMSIWNSSNRPPYPRNGMFGYNLETGKIEIYHEGSWLSVPA